MKKAFTLVELLIVICLIGILAGIMLGNYRGVIDKVQAAKCRANLKSLANGVGTCAVEGGYPFAESAQAQSELGTQIYEVKGWVSWLSQNQKFPIEGNSAASISHCSYAASDDEVTYALTNGAIWTAVGRNRDVYRCPVHVDACKRKGVRNPGWSYQMNAYFGHEVAAGQATEIGDPRKGTGELVRADRRLLFAEIPALDPSLKPVKKAMSRAGISKLPQINLNGGNNDNTMCGCLKYPALRASGTSCTIGFNHISGRDIVGHVAFADGHVEALSAPRNGQFDNLTDWLCQGYDIVVKDKSYDKIEGTDN